MIVVPHIVSHLMLI